LNKNKNKILLLKLQDNQKNHVQSLLSRIIQSEKCKRIASFLKARGLMKNL